LGLCAIAGALIITLILLRFARRHLSTSRLLLAGVALGIIWRADDMGHLLLHLI
jgi:vitamin B12 transport system permease protein